MAVERTEPAKPIPRKRSKTPLNPGLLGELIETHFYQVLIGKANPFSKSRKSKRRSHKSRNQSVGSMLIDVLIFAGLVVVAPFYTLIKFFFGTIGRFWIVRFTLGIATGLLALYVVYFCFVWLFGSQVQFSELPTGSWLSQLFG